MDRTAFLASLPCLVPLPDHNNNNNNNWNTDVTILLGDSYNNHPPFVVSIETCHEKVIFFDTTNTNNTNTNNNDPALAKVQIAIDNNTNNNVYLKVDGATFLLNVHHVLENKVVPEQYDTHENNNKSKVMTRPPSWILRFEHVVLRIFRRPQGIQSSTSPVVDTETLTTVCVRLQRVCQGMDTTNASPPTRASLDNSNYNNSSSANSGTPRNNSSTTTTTSDASPDPTKPSTRPSNKHEQQHDKVFQQLQSLHTILQLPASTVLEKDVNFLGPALNQTALQNGSQSSYHNNNNTTIQTPQESETTETKIQALLDATFPTRRSNNNEHGNNKTVVNSVAAATTLDKLLLAQQQQQTVWNVERESGRYGQH